MFRLFCGLAWHHFATALGARDQFIRCLVLGDKSRFHTEIDGLGMVGDDRHGRLLGKYRVAVREGHANLLEVQQAPNLLVLGLVRAGWVPPRVTPALVEPDAELAADFRMQPL